MDITTAFLNINFIAVFVAALSSFVIGGIWYSPALFANKWMKANRLSEEDLKQGSMAKIFSGAFVLSLITALILAIFLGPEADLTFGICAGFFVGLGYVATSFGITYLFERKSTALFFINAGFHVVTFLIMGAILGAWH